MLPAEPAPGARVYVVRVRRAPTASRSWLALDDGGARGHRSTGRPRCRLRRGALRGRGGAAALGDLDELRAQLVALRLTEAPPGIEEAEAAAAELQRTIGAPPQLASPARLDAIGAAVRRLELALDPRAPSPFAAAMQAARARSRSSCARSRRATAATRRLSDAAAARRPRLACGPRQLH